MRWARWISWMMLALLPAAAFAQEPLAPPEITGVAVYVPFPVNITLDGKLDDWAGVPMTTVTRGSAPSSVPAENGSFTFAVAADTDNFYIMMTMRDQTIITGKHGSDYWNEDSLEFYLNWSGNLAADSYTDQIFQVNINPGDIGKTDPNALTVTGVNSANTHVRGIVFKTPDGWGFEAAVPLPMPPKHGWEIGFQAQANGASKADRDVKLIWSLADKTDSSYMNPAVFGRALFFGIGQTDIPQPSAAAAEQPKPERAIVAVNQTGYFVNGAKRAVYGRAKALSYIPVWLLKDSATGQSVFGGMAADGVMDEASGDTVYVADFSMFNKPGTYVMSIDGVDSVPFRIGNDLYSPLKHDALEYFYRSRSGIPLEAQYAGKTWARPAGHVSDNSVTCFKGKDGDGKTWDGCDYHLDGSGGWYDAGDYGKYVVNGGISVWTLVNWYEHSPASFPDGSLSIPENHNGIPDILDEARWEMDFMLRMQVPQGEPLAGMVHHKLHDRHWSGVPAPLPETINSDDPNSGRFLMPPSTAATLNLAATGAQCARVWKTLDAAFADRCLQAAEIAWTAANAHPSLLYGNIPGDGGGNYDDQNVSDEFFWAAAELYITTGKDEYRDFVMQSPYFKDFSGLANGSTSAMSWGDTATLGTISLVTVPNGLPDSDITRLRGQIVATADHYLDTLNGQGYGVPLTINGYVWGSNSLVLNNAIILALAHDFTGDSKYLTGVSESMDYILGRNAVNQSFVSGYGTNALQHPHHRFWGDQPDKGFPPVPPGVVSGGPNGTPADPDAIQKVSDLPTARRYLDELASYSTNEVAINWNAPLVWVAAYLDEKFNR